ncbi:hypothetical protein [Specibacter sp. NPDC078692]|uniref:hypothetical protein n=1 Tax=Specibacter sp. NPDC078692 TaxID=3155818 RepID=UPI003423CBCB
MAPSNTVVVHELAVDSDYRGQRNAKSCLASALENRTESSIVLGVYERAEDARSDC